MQPSKRMRLNVNIIGCCKIQFWKFLIKYILKLIVDLPVGTIILYNDIKGKNSLLNVPLGSGSECSLIIYKILCWWQKKDVSSLTNSLSEIKRHVWRSFSYTKIGAFTTYQLKCLISSANTIPFRPTWLTQCRLIVRLDIFHPYIM